MNHEVKEHYRAYKAGKKWIFALMFTGAMIAGGAVAETQHVQAATATTQAVTTQTQATTKQAATKTVTKAAPSSLTTSTSSQNSRTQSQTGATGSSTTTAASTTATSTAATTPATSPSTAVGTKDSKGNYSADPALTGDPHISVTQDNMDHYFTATNLAGDKLPINGNQVQLTTGHETETDANGNTDYSKGTGLVHENQQVDFSSDFALNATVKADWDPSMSDWLGGDGMSLFFENVAPDQANKDMQTGSGFGISSDASKVISFNVSTNALKYSPVSYTDANGVTHTNYPQSRWTLYESNGDTRTALDAPLVTDVPIEDNTTGSISYTFDVAYTAATRTLTTRVYDASNTLVDTWVYNVPADWVGDGFTLAFTGNTAASHAAYSATINAFTYTAVTTTMAVKSSGLPSNSQGPDQDNIAGIAGDVIAFYPGGQEAPTTDANGNAVTNAYAVAAVGDYVLKDTQFITLSKDASQNTVTLPFAAKGTVAVHYVNNAGAPLQPATILTGWAGDAYTVDVPQTVGGLQYLDTASGSAPLSGTYRDGTDAIYLVYGIPAPTTSTLTLNYVDQNGNTLQPTTQQTVTIGQNYTVTPATIAGYTFDWSSLPLTGTATAADQTITLVYSKNAVVPKTSTLTIKYVDENGHTLKPATTQTVTAGEAYTVTPATIDGYTYAKSSAPLTGTATATDQTITLVYTKNKTTHQAGIYGYLAVGSVTAVGVAWVPVFPCLSLISPRIPVVAAVSIPFVAAGFGWYC